MIRLVDRTHLFVAGQAAAREVGVKGMDQRIRVLERKFELDKDAADAAANAAATLAAAALGFSHPLPDILGVASEPRE